MTSAAIIGKGFIGQAQIRMFTAVFARQDLVTYDPAWDDSYPGEAIAGCDFAVICVGTPPAADGSADLRYVDDAVGRLPGSLPVLIRSTVPPGTTARIQSGREGLACHAPEFMHERPGGAWAQSTDVPFLILGGTPEARGFFAPHLAKFFPNIHGCAAVTAELVKYTINLYLATRVTFINEMAAVCRATGGNWEDVRKAWLMDPRITPEYTGMAGYTPGFGGRCWPKDLSALIIAAADAGYEPEFLEAVADANERFRG